MKKFAFAIALYALFAIYNSVNAQQNIDNNLPEKGSQEKCLTDILNDALLESSSSYKAKKIIEDSNWHYYTKPRNIFQLFSRYGKT